MKGDEARVVDAFCEWLTRRGWAVQREQAFADVEATRSGHRLLAEAKGRTTSVGLDVGTLYGQLPRRIPPHASAHDTLAVVVPDGAIAAAERVPAEVRRLLNIHIFGVSHDGVVKYVGDGPDPTD